MQRARSGVWLLACLLASLVAGCLGDADADYDPLAYMRRPLYASSFDLAELDGETARHEFRVTDGSILHMTLRVWVNASSGAASVRILTPGGEPVIMTSESTTLVVPLELGVWTVEVTSAPLHGARPSGDASITVARR